MTSKTIALISTSLILTVFAPSWVRALTDSVPTQEQELEHVPKGKGGGGAGTGGGGTIGSHKVSPSQVERYILDSKAPSVYIFRRFEILFAGGNAGVVYNQLWDKLFKGSKTVFDALNEAQFKPKLNGPCYIVDKNGNKIEKEASALNFPEICFNLKMIADRVNSDSVQAEVLALVVHEVSHGMGTDEPEAELIQKMTKDSLANDPFKKILSLASNYRFIVTSTLASLDQISTQLPTLSQAETCVGLTVLLTGMGQANMRNVDGAFDNEKNGIALSGLSETRAMMGSIVRTSALLTYCMTSLPDYQKFINAFDGRTQMPLAEFQNKVYPPMGPVFTPTAGTIRRVKPDDKATLQLELQDLRSTLTEVLNKL